MLASLSGCVTDNGEKPDVIKHMENTDNQNWGMPTKFITIKILDQQSTLQVHEVVFILVLFL